MFPNCLQSLKKLSIYSKPPQTKQLGLPKPSKRSKEQSAIYTEKLEKAKNYLRNKNKYAIEMRNNFVYTDSSGRVITPEEIEKVKKEVIRLRKVI